MLQVAIIGGGVQGVALLRELSSVQNIKCTLYEARPTVGGFWNNENNVPYLSLQIALRHYRFPDFPHPKEVTMASAAYVNEYVSRYVTLTGLEASIRLNTPVVDVREEGDGCSLKMANGTWVHYDVAICTGKTSIANIPPIYTSHRHVVHTSALSAVILAAASNTRCVVVGGSKSAAEAVYHLRQAGARVVWVARKFYSFGEYADNTTISLSTVLRCLPRLLWSGNADCMFPLRMQDSDDLNAGSGNILLRSEYEDLRACPKLTGKVVKTGPDGIHLADGQWIPCDLLVLGTGYHHNKCALTFQQHTQKTIPCSSKRVFSCIDLYPGLLTTFGPINAHLTASLFSRYLAEGWPRLSFNAFAQQDYTRERVKLAVYQIQYLLTSGAMAPYNHYRTPAVVYAIAGLVVALLVAVVAVGVVAVKKAAALGAVMFTRI